MKALSCVIALLYFAINVSCAQATSAISLDQIVRLLGKADVNGVVGWEMIPDSRESISDSKAVLLAISKMDLVSVIKAISDETDYECVVGQGFILIRPKTNPSFHDLALSMRRVSFPEATNVPYNQILEQLKSADDMNYRIFVCNSSQYMGQTIDGAINLKGGKEVCYEVLNDMAKQLKANYWTMGHMVLPDPLSKKAKLPMTLNVGLLSFFSNDATMAGTWSPPLPRGLVPANANKNK